MAIPQLPVTGRPHRVFSKTRYRHCLAALNRLLQDPKQPAINILRATELVLACHNLNFPRGVDHRMKRSVKQLVTETNIEHSINQQIDSQIEAERSQAREQAEAKAEEITRLVYSSVLDESAD
jgi:hypothetical protein